MHHKQQIVLGLGLLAAVGVVLFPPYRVSSFVGPRNILSSAGENGPSTIQYSFLLTAPSYSSISWPHLAFGLGLVLLMTIIVLIILKIEEDRPRI
jgi:hypothetical protein